MYQEYGESNWLNDPSATLRNKKVLPAKMIEMSSRKDARS